MNTKTRKRMRLIVALAATAALMFATIPSASAGDIQGSFAGTAVLPAGIGVCPSNGTASFPVVAGTHNGAPAQGTATASFSYCNPDVIAGTASGTITVRVQGGGNHVCGFSWVRTGATAAVTFRAGPSGQPCSGSANAAFAPAPQPDGSTLAAVTGVATISTSQ